MATLQKQTSNPSQPLTSLSAERRASRFRLTDDAKEWLTIAGGCRCDSAKLWLLATRDGSFGKTSHTLLQSTTDELLPASFNGWGNSGLAVRGECLTLATSECPNDGAESSLWDIIDRGNSQERHFLSREAMTNMLRRLEKYGQKHELTDTLRELLLDGQETRPPSTE